MSAGVLKNLLLAVAAGVGVFGVLPVLYSSAPVEQEPSALVESPDRGKQAFISNCGGCHGLDGRGGEHAPNIATNPITQQLSQQAIAGVVENGIPSHGMPAFNFMGPGNIKAVVDYLWVLQGKRSRLAITGNPEHGRVLFYTKARCSACHMVNGAGGFLGADLSAYSLVHSPVDIRAAVLNPNKKLGALGGTVTAVTRAGQSWIGLARNEDNFSLQLQTEDGRFHLFMKSELASLKREPRSLMPSDYRARLSDQELDDIVSFLVKAAQTPVSIGDSGLNHQ